MCDKEFIKDCLVQMLGEDASDEMVQYILTIESEDDFNEFMDNIVDKSTPSHIAAYEALKANLFQSDSNTAPLMTTEKFITNTNSTNQRIEPIESSNKQFVSKNAKQVETRGKKQQQQQQKVKHENRSFAQKQQQVSNNVQAAPSKDQDAKQPSHSGAKGKKLKFVNFYSQDHRPGLLKGRHPCNCEARKHCLINNCIKCGRIVCEQEGSGPCFFCDNMVCTNEEMELLTANTKESDKLYNYLMERSKSKEWKKAIETRDRLLLSDKLGSAKNVVYDDQSDYFKVDSSGIVVETENKDNDRAKMDFYSGGRFPRNEMKVSLHLATRTVTVEENDGVKNKDKLLKDIHKLLEMHSKRYPKYFADKDNSKVEAEELMKELMKEDVQTEIEETPTREETNNQGFALVDTIKSANEQLQEVVDAGMCLSMHQPYASLLVAGIKRHEGRTWRTNHRGRLWIAAAAKQPADDEILQCEEMYKNYYCDPSLKFPRTYPVSCLLGCVHVEDCLPQVEYRQLYPNGESTSPFVLVCRNPVILPIFYPMSGQHKIFPLKKDLHRRAKAALLSATWVD